MVGPWVRVRIAGIDPVGVGGKAEAAWQGGPCSTGEEEPLDSTWEQEPLVKVGGPNRPGPAPGTWEGLASPGVENWGVGGRCTEGPELNPASRLEGRRGNGLGVLGLAKALGVQQTVRRKSTGW